MAIALVLFAVLISAFRLLLPYAHNYKLGIEDYINKHYQSNVHIGEISLGWQRFGPTLIAKEIRLLQTQNTRVGINNIDVRIDFWQSLSERNIVAHHINLDGVEVFYDQTVELLPSSNNEVDSEQVLLDNIIDLFLSQIDRFSLNNSEITVKNEHNQRTFLINHLNWLNRGEQHNASGDVRIGGLSSDHLKLLVDLRGSDKNQMSGQVYLQANQLNITPWLGSIFAIENDKTDSNINFDAWLSLENGITKSLQVQLGENEISWQHDNIEQQFLLNQGQVFVSRHPDNKGFALHTSPLNLTLDNHQWQPLNIEVNQNHQGLFAYVSELDLASAATVFPLLVEQPETRLMLAELAPQGQVDDIYFQRLGESISVSANFDNVSTGFSQGIPGMDNISGHALFAKDILKVDFSAENGALDFDKHFMAPIVYNNITSEILLRFEEQGITFDANNLELVSDELALSADVRVTIPKQGLAEMALLASVKDGNAKVADHYYPHLLMGEPLVKYLQNGILDGKLAQAQVLFNGPFAKFPFTEPEGIFVVDAELTDGVFSFDSQWPAIENLSANLNFTNNGMLITARAGQLTGLDVEGVTTQIADFTEGVLTVDAIINQADPANVTKLMLASSMKSTVGKTLEHVVVTQPISGTFNLNLPLANTEQVVASGLIDFDNNNVAVQAPQLNFTKASGQLSFNNDVIKVENIEIDWLGLPLKVQVSAEQQQEYYGTNLTIDALWQEAQWQQQVPDILKPYSGGELQWQGILALHNHIDGGFSYNFDINSDLNNTELKLPQPYFKALAQQQALNINVTGRIEQSTINATLGEQLSFYGELDHQGAQFSRSHLVLGDEQMLLPMDGFHITTKLAQAKLSEWQPFISDILDSISAERSSQVSQNDIQENAHLLASSAELVTEKPMLFPVPERIRGTIAELDVVGQPFTQISFNLLDQSTWWLLEFNAKEARSQIKFYPDWFAQGIDVNADFFHLPVISNEKLTNAQLTSESAENEHIATTQTAELNDLIMANFPPLKFHCDSCSYGQLDLGTVDFTVARAEPDKLLVNQFRAQRNKSELTFDLSWEHNQQGSTTKLVGDLDIKDLEAELDKFEYASMMKESGGTSSFDIHWQGAPQDFVVASLNGDINVTFDDGYLADVGDSARLFSVLSLQSLVRKLTLDFRDIFSDGMFYSSIKGDFNIKDGILYTNNMKMNGAAGDLLMIGNTDLDLGQLDYSLSYKPNLTSSLPVLAWIATLQPAVFLAGIAIDQVMTSQVVSEFNFELTGTLDEPDFKEVDRKTKDISVGRSTPPQIVESSEAIENSEALKKLEQTPKDGEKIKSKNLSQDNTNG